MKRPKTIPKSESYKPPPSSLSALHPLNRMVCPRCRLAFKGFILNEPATCNDCGQGYLVIRASKEFYVLT